MPAPPTVPAPTTCAYEVDETAADLKGWFKWDSILNTAFSCCDWRGYSYPNVWNAIDEAQRLNETLLDDEITLYQMEGEAAFSYSFPGFDWCDPHQKTKQYSLINVAWDPLIASDMEFLGF